MSMKRKAMQITLPGYINDFLHELMEEMGFNKSVLIEQLVFYVSMPENLKDFKSQYEIGYEDDDNDDNGDNDDEDEDEEEEEDDDVDEDE